MTSLSSFLAFIYYLFQIIPGLGRGLEKSGFEIEEMMQRARSEFQVRASRTAVQILPVDL